MGIEQRRSDDAARSGELAPQRHAAGHEEVTRGRIDPAEKIGEPDDLRGIAVAEFDLGLEDDDARHDGLRKAAGGDRRQVFMGRWDG